MQIVLFFLVFPLAELALLIRVGSSIGVFATLLLLCLSGVIGVLMIRLAGLTTALRARESLARGEVPERELLQGLVSVVAGGLLLLPGFLSDIMALLILFPPSRRFLLLMLQRRLEAQVTGHAARGPADRSSRSASSRPHEPHRPETIEGEWERRD